MKPEWVEFIVKNWHRMTATKIAEALGGRVTRNAVIGRAHRMKLGNKSKVPPPRKGQKSAPHKPAAKKVVKLFSGRTVYRKPPVAPPPPEGVSFEELEGFHCKWITGDGRDPRYCGKNRVEGKSYCFEHCKTAYVRWPA
jgi:GcrA cell cycle regulator